MNNKYLLKFDWYTFLVYFALVSIGLINVYSTGHTLEENMFSLNHTFWKAVVFALLSIGLIFFIQFPKVKIYERYSSIFYLIIIALLVSFVLEKKFLALNPGIHLGALVFNQQSLQKWSLLWH